MKPCHVKYTEHFIKHVRIIGFCPEVYNRQNKTKGKKKKKGRQKEISNNV